MKKTSSKKSRDTVPLTIQNNMNNPDSQQWNHFVIGKLALVKPISKEEYPNLKSLKFEVICVLNPRLLLF
jgi:hypothetical protein